MRLLIRADANKSIGTGHIMRCIALAQAWEAAGGRAIFVSCCDMLPVKEKLEQQFTLVELESDPGGADDLKTTLQAAEKYQIQWLAADGYHFESEYQLAVRAKGLHLLMLDDYGHFSSYQANIILNQNLGADESLYDRRPSDSQLLAGPKYALIRPEFLSTRASNRIIPNRAHKVLITMGGSDPHDFTASSLNALRQMDLTGLKITIVAGSGYSAIDNLISSAESLDADIEIVTNPSNMPEIMRESDLAVTGAGSTLWELALLGTPCMVVVLADNQAPVASAIDAGKAGINLGWHYDISSSDLAASLNRCIDDQPLRQALSENGRNLVDGRGAGRVVSKMLNQLLIFKKPSRDDCRRVWQLSNDPSVRSSSFSSVPINWDEHVDWFERKISEESVFFRIVENTSNEMVGLVRFEHTDEKQGDPKREFTISVCLAPEFQGMGLGAVVIAMSCRQFLGWTDVGRVNAYTKSDNLRSVRAFERAGFTRCPPVTINRKPAFHLTVTRDDL